MVRSILSLVGSTKSLRPSASSLTTGARSLLLFQRPHSTTIKALLSSSTSIPSHNVSCGHRPFPSSLSLPQQQPAARTMSSSTSTSVMRAVLIKDGKGPSSSLYIGEAPIPTLEQDQVLVKVKAFGLNRMDILQREGQYPLPPGASSILGVEFSGTVVDSGDATQGSKKWSAGQEVFGLATGGAYAEYIKVSSKMILEKPNELSWEQAAAIPENFLTAYQALRVISDMKPGEDVLVHAGASGVGVAAIQLANAFGAGKVYITAGSEEKVEFCESIGAFKGINYKATDWGSELSRITGSKTGSVDVIVDFVGAPYFASNLESLKRDGRMVMLAFMGGAKVKEANIATLLLKRLRIEGSTLRSRSLEYQGELVQGFVREKGLERLIKGCGGDQGHKIVIHKVYPWSQIKEAHDEMEANRNIGKIIVTVE